MVAANREFRHAAILLDAGSINPHARLRRAISTLTAGVGGVGVSELDVLFLT
jgi:hypothetical protein